MTKYIADETLIDWFSHHPPTNREIIVAHETVRSSYLELALKMNTLLPEGPDKTIALRAIRDAAMYANACIAVSQAVYQPESGEETTGAFELVKDSAPPYVHRIIDSIQTGAPLDFKGASVPQDVQDRLALFMKPSSGS